MSEENKIGYADSWKDLSAEDVLLTDCCRSRTLILAVKTRREE